jgi:ribosome-associated protein
MRKNLALLVREDADSLTLVKRVVHACEEVKGRDIAILDVHSISDFADYFVVVSGRSDRQVQGITNRVIEELCKCERGQWVLVDCGEIVVHIFYEPVREFYDIESLWMRARKISIPEVA